MALKDEGTTRTTEYQPVTMHSTPSVAQWPALAPLAVATKSEVIARWLPSATIVHPWPGQRFRVSTQGKSPVRQSRPLGSVRGAARAQRRGPSLPRRCYGLVL